MTTPTIRLPNGSYVTAGMYAKAWDILKTEHKASLYAGREKTYSGFFDYPAHAPAILAELRKGLADRINRHDPAYGKGRRWDTDYQAALARDAKMLRYFRAYGGVGVPRQRFETCIFLKRYGRPDDVQ